MLLTLIIILLLTLGCDGYITLSVLKTWPLWAKSLVVAPTILMFFCLYLVIRGNWGWAAHTSIALLICCLMPKLIFTLLSLTGRGVGILFPRAYCIISCIGLVIAIIVCLGGLYGTVFGWKHLIVKNLTIDSPTLPAGFDGYKIVQISDLHLGTFGNDSAHIRRMVDKVNALNPDLIVFTGDLINFSHTEVSPFKVPLSRLHAKDGVVSILGNHDYAIYSRNPGRSARDSMMRSLIRTEREMYWNLLLDQNQPIIRGNDTIYIVGVQNIGRKFSANTGDLNKAMQGIPMGSYCILLSHDPTHWEDAIKGKLPIPLTLSGHTHAMQTRIFGWSPSSWVFRYWGGLYKTEMPNSANNENNLNEGMQHLYVNTGTGGNLPFRFGAWPEITLLTLHK